MNYSVPEPAPSVGSGIAAFWPVFLVIGIIFVILVIYHETVGYYVQYGWNSIWDLISKKDDVDISIVSEDKQPLVEAKLAKYDENTEKKAEEERNRIRDDAMQQQSLSGPSSMQSQSQSMSQSSSSEDRSFLPSFGGSKTVYNISENVYTYYDAPAVCKALNGELATYDQVKQAHDDGADWCNYGWIKGQQAVFPTQKATWEKLQKGSPDFAKSCGKPGVNGGHFDNPELRFGVNCYGVRPAKKPADDSAESQVALPPSAEEIEFDKRVQRYRENINTIAILPFSRSKN
jgi:hypothetical protein